jgi:hypothetical protein
MTRKINKNKKIDEVSNKNNPHQPPIYPFLPPILSPFRPHTANANVKLHVTQTIHGRRKTNEDNKTNKPNQHIYHERTNGHPRGCSTTRVQRKMQPLQKQHHNYDE